MRGKYYVFRMDFNYDDSDMETAEFDSEDALRGFFNQRLAGKDPAEAAKLLKEYHVIHGERVEPTIKKVIERVEVDL